MSESKGCKFNCINCGQCCREMENLALFEWEKKRLLEFDPSTEIVPGNKIKYGKTDIILYWGLKGKGGQCPFLRFEKEKSKCSIYNDRPLVCRSFPLSHSGQVSIEGMIATNCPASVVPFKENERMSRAGFYKTLLSAYGETFESVFRLDLARVWVADIADLVVSELESNDVRLEDKEIGLFELAAREGIIDQEAIDLEIENLESLDVTELFNSAPE